MSKRKTIGFQYGPYIPESPDTPTAAASATEDGDTGPGGIKAGPVFHLPTGELVRMTEGAYVLAATVAGPDIFAQALAQHFAGIRQGGMAPEPGTVTTSRIHPPGRPGEGLVFFTMSDEPAACTVVTIAEMQAAEGDYAPTGATVN